eukprot:1553141-Pleurochrysis_carterae.AAC.1
MRSEPMCCPAAASASLSAASSAPLDARNLHRGRGRVVGGEADVEERRAKVASERELGCANTAIAVATAIPFAIVGMSKLGYIDRPKHVAYSL